MISEKFKTDETEQSLIFGYNIDDFIDEVHLVRIVDKIVDKLDTTKIENRYSALGQKSYNPKSMIKVLFYGYSIGVFSSRKIKRACEKDLEFMYLMRMYKPDHRTISDFRKNNLNEITEYFVDILKYCNEIGMLKAGNIAIDGSKFRANATSDRTKNIAGYERWESRLKEEIKLLNAEAEKIDEEENKRLDKKTDSKDLSKKIKSRNDLIEKIEKAKEYLKTVKAEYVKEKTKKEPKINLTDSDAHFQKERIGVIRPNYNAQIATTTDQIIVGVDVITEAGDRQSLIPMIEDVEKNTNEKVVEVKADSGYSSYENYEKLEKKNITGYIPDQNFRKIRNKKINGTLEQYHKENFIYNSEENIYKCPEGKTLKKFKERNDKYRQNISIYKCSDCINCNNHEKCTTAKSRTITRHNSEHLQEAMREKLETSEGKRKYYERMNMVETPFGHLKKNLGFKQFYLRGLEKVKGEFKLLCIGFNLMKIFKWELVNI